MFDKPGRENTEGQVHADERECLFYFIFLLEGDKRAARLGASILSAAITI